MPSARKLSFLETRRTQQGGECNTTKLVSSVRTHPICFPPFLLDSKSLRQNSTGPSSDNDTCGASLANTTLVPQTSTIINSQSKHHTSHAKSTAKCRKGGSSICGKQNIKISGLVSFKKSLTDSGLSKSATNLISSARRPSSNSNYDSSWGKWVGWCSRKEIDPVQCFVNFILDFLAELSDLGYKYRSINSCRSAISAYHCYVEGKTVEQLKQMCALLRGVFTKKPPQSRYAFTWDVQAVLDFVKNKWGNSNSLSDRDLTFKLLILLALTSTSRACTLHCLDIRFTARHTHFVQVMFGRLHKGWKSGKKFACC